MFDYNYTQRVYPQDIQGSVYTNEQRDSVSKKINYFKRFFLRSLNIKKYPSFPISETQTISMTKFGFPLVNLTKDKGVSSEIRKEGYYQTEDNLRVLRTYIKPGHTVINAGAFIGDDAVFLGKLVGENGRVFAFEPNAIAFDCLRKNIILNDLENNVTVYPYGVSDIDVVAHQNFSFNNVGGAVVCEGAPSSSKAGAIELRKIDTLIKDKVDFIFMDVEGYEFKALYGMEKLLQKSDYPPIFMEWSPDLLNKAGPDMMEFIDKAHSWGYKFYKVVKYRKEKTNRHEAYKYELLTKEDLKEGHKDVLLVQDKDFRELNNS